MEEICQRWNKDFISTKATDCALSKRLAQPVVMNAISIPCAPHDVHIPPLNPCCILLCLFEL